MRTDTQGFGGGIFVRKWQQILWCCTGNSQGGGGKAGKTWEREWPAGELALRSAGYSNRQCREAGADRCGG